MRRTSWLRGWLARAPSVGARLGAGLRAALRAPLDPLSSRAIAGVTAAALATAGISVWASVSASTGFLRGEAALKLPTLLAAVGDRARMWTTERRLDVRTFAGSARLREALDRAAPQRSRRAASILEATRRRHPAYRAFWLLDARGAPLAATNDAGTPSAALRRLAARAPAARWSDARRELLVAEPAADAVLVAAVAVAGLDGALDAIPFRAAALYVTSRTGSVIARAGAADGRARERPLAAMPDDPLAVAETTRGDGTPVVRSARLHPDLGWTFVVEEPARTAVEPVGPFVRRVLGVNLAVAGAFVAVALFLSRTATAPLRGLYREARRIASRGGPDGGDAAGVVVRAFHELRERARAMRRELREKQRELAHANERLRARNEELRRANAVLARLSVTDELTRLHNHRFFRESLPRELKRSLRTGTPLSLVLFDIDDFKALNDRYGHAVGDAILARVAEVMRSAVREVHLLARYGGEEFALLAPGTPEAGAVALAEKIRLAVSDARFSVIAPEGPQSVRVTVSAGVAAFDGDERTLFHDADCALYRAKAAGKDCVMA